MHDDLTRQLRALAAAVLILLGHAHARAEDARAATIEDKLRAAKVIEIGLAAREAGAEEWRKLDQIYGDLAAEYPADARVRNARAESLWTRDERDRALAEWTAAEKLDAKNAAVLDHLADAWLAEGDVRKAAGYAARAVASEPGNAGYHFALANLTFLFRHDLTNAASPDSGAVLQKALTHFSEASRLAPLNSDYARSYAETFYSLPTPDWEAALAAWTHYREIAPKKDFAWLNLARVQLKLGRKQEAMDCLSSIQGPEFKKLKQRLEAQARAQSESSAR